MGGGSGLGRAPFWGGPCRLTVKAGTSLGPFRVIPLLRCESAGFAQSGITF